MDQNLYPFIIPYDSSYMEALLKGSLEATIGPVAAAFTLRGAFLFGGKNEFAYVDRIVFGSGGLDLDGDVAGWRLGGDLWLRYPLSADLAIPFLVRIDYREKERDGDGVGLPGVPPVQFNYENKEDSFEIEVGGGLEKEFAKGTRGAAGIYYSYLHASTEFELTGPAAGLSFDRSDCPDYFEHRIQLRLAVQHELTPSIDLQMGLYPFIGWAQENYSNTEIIYGMTENVNLDGFRWGIGASLGATVRISQGFAVEPFFAGGYQATSLDGHGWTNIMPLGYIDMDKQTEEWFVSTGLSFLFDL